MDRDTIRRMDPEVFQETLKEAVMDDVACVLNINKGHATSLHAGQSINDMVNRLIKEEKQAVSSFLDTDSLIYDLQDAIYYSANDIANWISMDRNEFKNPQDYHEMAFSLHMDEDAIGNGILKDGSLKETTEMTVVLQRDFTGESPFGFFVKTAYADIQHEKAILTGKIDLQEYIHRNIKFKTPLEKAYYDLRNKYPNDNIQLRQKQGQQYIQVSKNNEDRRIMIYINELDQTIKEYNGNSCNRLSLGKCFIDYPDIVSLINDAKNTMNEREQIMDQILQNER